MSDEQPPTPSSFQLAKQAGQVLTERDQIIAELKLAKLYQDMEDLKTAHNALFAEVRDNCLKKSAFKAWKPALIALGLALLTPIAASIWSYLQGFHLSR